MPLTLLLAIAVGCMVAANYHFYAMVKALQKIGILGKIVPPFSGFYVIAKYEENYAGGRALKRYRRFFIAFVIFMVSALFLLIFGKRL
jgi:uncharacterized membrane protein